MLVLSSAVILGIYDAGYTRTEADARRAAASLAHVVAQAAAASASQTSASAPAASAAGAAAAPTGAASGTAPAAAGSGSAQASARPTGFKDGTYTAQGWGPHGFVTVAVVISAGRITSANVVSCGTTYACYYLDPLVQEVVARQSAPVDYVSGATASSMAYQQAVAQALSQAH